MIKKLKKSKQSKLPYILGAVVILVAIGLFFIYHVNHKTKLASTVDQYTKGQVSKQNSSTNSSNKSPGSSGGSETVESTTSSLLAPTGNFVSDHHPNLSGSPAPSSMTSVCNTTPGASCQITFTDGNTIKSLPTQVTDAGGATYWYWTLQSIGLTAGSWQVKAIATLGSQSQSTTDAMELVVSP